MEITEEHCQRAEANRLATLEKHKRATERSNDDPWRLFRYHKIPSPTLSSSKEDPDPINNSNPPHPPPPAVAVRFLIVIEICSPTEFSVTPQPLNGFTFPGGLECFRELKHVSLRSLPTFAFLR
ncbi:uncharacterized protein A4U43_C02F14090 [Asparagus officinalis]|uniref:Uncharacterized protein n=1 Tax=Asparagus officinalis TaxID=4686 RepID=A0A5P1FM84_ASPOF|nr:uncharacterized protein A4U43_C02F14090 [Asparagus officinalis]